MNATARTLLIVEDDAGLQTQLRWSFDEYVVIVAGDRESALAEVRSHRPAVVLQDLGLPPDPAGTSEGFATIASILEEAPYTKIIVATGNGDRDNAVKAIGAGAYDFCSKPLDVEVLRLVVDRAFRVHELEAENRKLKSESGTAMEGIIGTSEAMTRAFRLVEKVGPTSASVLLLGETGTGKELVA
ncbi:MAG TPA: response regulator, partial [Rhodanobacteraceae bacterium]|nr:response regulator [Rhodanobacteraceae bacterium]